MFEIDKIQSDTYTFDLMLPNGEIREDVKITVRGDSHPDVKAYARKALLQSEQRRMVNKRKGRGADAAIDEDELDYLEDLGLNSIAVRVQSIMGLTFGGTEIGTSRENIAKVLKEYTWLAEQVKEKSSDLASFCIRGT